MNIIIKLKSGGVSTISVDKEASQRDFELHYERPPADDNEIAKFEFEKSERIIGANAVSKSRHVSWRILTEELPPRNYRNAWEDYGTVKVNLEKAKPIQKRLAIQKAKERIPKDEWGNQDLTQVQAEIEALDFAAAATLDELYNTWPASIERRNGPRAYPHG